MTPRPNTYKHPLDMAVHIPEPMPESWLERHAGKIALSAILLSVVFFGSIILWFLHAVLCW